MKSKSEESKKSRLDATSSRSGSNASKRLLKNGAFLYLLTFSNYFIGLLLFPYISRVLSVEGFGLISFSMMYVMIFQVIVEFGFMISTTALISKNRNDMQKVSEIVSSVMTAKILLSVVSALLFFISAIFVPMLRENLLVVSLFFVSSIFVAMLPDFYFRGVEKMRTITIRTVSARVLSLVIVVLLVRDETQISWIPVAFIVGNLIAFVAAVTEAHKEGVRFKPVGFGRAFGDIKQATMFFLSRLATSLNKSMGSFALGMKFSPASVEMGLFSGAARVSMAGDMMLQPVSDSIYPHMVNKKDYRLFRKVVVLGGVLWFLGCSVVFIFAELVCGILLGDQFTGAGDLLRILLFGNLMAFFSNMFGYNALTPIGKSLHANTALVVSAVVNVVAYVTLWLTDSISMITVCLVMAATNFMVLGYRAAIFWRYRHLVKELDVSKRVI